MATIIAVTQSVRSSGTYTFDGGATVPSGLQTATFQIILDLADKLAVGKTFTWKFYFSTDNTNWVFANGGGWTSYGPSGLTYKDIDGTTVTNPNPKLTISLTDKAGKFIRGELVLNSSLNAGVTINVV